MDQDSFKKETYDLITTIETKWGEEECLFFRLLCICLSYLVGWLLGFDTFGSLILNIVFAICIPIMIGVASFYLVGIIMERKDCSSEIERYIKNNYGIFYNSQKNEKGINKAVKNWKSMIISALICIVPYALGILEKEGPLF